MSSIVNIQAEWPNILPHLKGGVRDIYIRNVRSWIADHGWQDDKPIAKTWTPESKAPWKLSLTDFWCTHIDEKIEGASATDPDVQEFNDLDPEYTGKKEDWDRYHELDKLLYYRYGPTEAEPGFWFPVLSCDHLRETVLNLARLWKPTEEWVIVTQDNGGNGLYHVFAQSPNLVFDPYLWDQNHDWNKCLTHEEQQSQ